MGSRGEVDDIARKAADFVSARPSQQAKPEKKKKKAVAVMQALGAGGWGVGLGTSPKKDSSGPTPAPELQQPPAPAQPPTELPPSLAGLALSFGSSAAAQRFVGRVQAVAKEEEESSVEGATYAIAERSLRRRRRYRDLFRTHASRLDEVVLTSPSGVTSGMTMKQALKDIAREDFVLNGNMFSVEDEALDRQEDEDLESEFEVVQGGGADSPARVPPPPPMTFQSPRRATERFLRTVSQLLTRFVEARRSRDRKNVGGVASSVESGEYDEETEHEECKVEHEECMRRICFACSRTLSGGDTYEAVATLFGGGVLVTPWLIGADEPGTEQQQLPVEVEISSTGFAKVVTPSVFEVRSWESIEQEDGMPSSAATNNARLLIAATLSERLDFDTGGVFEECRRTLTLELVDSPSSLASPAKSPAFETNQGGHAWGGGDQQHGSLGVHWPSFKLFQ
jgi:hypothetical protein